MTLLGGAWPWIGLVVPMTVMLAGDRLLPEDVRDRKYRHPGILDALLFAQLGWTFIAATLLCWTFAPGDALSIGAFAERQMGLKVLAAHDQRSVLSMLGVVLSVSLLTSANYFVAHELIHRRSRLAVAIGNCLLAFVGDTQFYIAHLYEHHKHVCTPDDPASARRGESLYVFALRSSYGQYVGAMRIERARLAAQGLPAWHPANRFLRGQAMTIAIVCVMVWAFGLWAALAYAMSMVWAKLLYEAVNYIQHYGLVRVPGSAVEPRHSWDCTASMSSAFMFNLTRHADHHARADIPFWELRTDPLSPRHTRGYFATIMLALLPPLWSRHMKDQLAYWDQHFASANERSLVNSGKHGRD